MKIGELAKKAGCRVVTIRYYEKKGLMPEPERGGGNYRVYGEADMRRLNFIRHCRLHGMSLEEIQDLIAISSTQGACARVHPLLDRHIKNIEAQIAALSQLKDSLEVIRSQCDGQGDKCGVLKSLRNLEECAYCRHNEPPGQPANFAASCHCLPEQTKSA